MRVKFLAEGNNGSLRWGSNSRLTEYDSNALPTVTARSYILNMSYNSDVLPHKAGWFRVHLYKIDSQGASLIVHYFIALHPISLIISEYYIYYTITFISYIYNIIIFLYRPWIINLINLSNDFINWFESPVFLWTAGVAFLSGPLQSWPDTAITINDPCGKTSYL